MLWLNPEANIHKHLGEPLSSCAPAKLATVCSGGSIEFPPGTTQSAKTAAARLTTLSHESGRDTSIRLTLAVTLSEQILRQIKATRH